MKTYKPKTVQRKEMYDNHSTYIDDLRERFWFRVGKEEILYMPKDYCIMTSQKKDEKDIYDAEVIFSEGSMDFNSALEAENNLLIVPQFDGADCVVVLNKNNEIKEKEIISFHWKHGETTYKRYIEEPKDFDE